MKIRPTIKYFELSSRNPLNLIYQFIYDFHLSIFIYMNIHFCGKCVKLKKDQLKNILLKILIIKLHKNIIMYISKSELTYQRREK